MRVAAAYPGTPATEMLEVVSTYPDIYAEWSVNERFAGGRVRRRDGRFACVLRDEARRRMSPPTR